MSDKVAQRMREWDRAEAMARMKRAAETPGPAQGAALLLYVGMMKGLI